MGRVDGVTDSDLIKVPSYEAYEALDSELQKAVAYSGCILRPNYSLANVMGD